MNPRHARVLLKLIPLAATVVASTASARSPSKVIDEEHCFTEPVPTRLVPDEIEEHFALGSPVHGDGALWSVAPDSTWFEVVTPDSVTPDATSGGLKFAWWRLEAGRIEVAIERVPSSEDDIRPGVPWDPPRGTAHVLDGYGLTGLQVSGLEFPEAGCWSITGELVSPDSPRQILATMSLLLWIPRPMT